MSHAQIMNYKSAKAREDASEAASVLPVVRVPPALMPSPMDGE
jgi:hypothetical protein